MSRLTRDGTAEPVSRDQILRRKRGQGKNIFPVQLTTSRIGNLTRLILTLLAKCDDHTYINTYIHNTYIHACITSIIDLLLRGSMRVDGCRQESTRLHAISCSKTGWSSLTHNWVLHQALARSLRESNFRFAVEDAWPFRQRASGQNGRLNPLRMDFTTEAGALFGNHPRLKNKAPLLDIAIVNPCAGSSLGNAACHVGKHLADAVERKKNKYRGSFSATYSLLPLAMSTCGEVGSDVHVLINRHQTGTAQVGDTLQ